MNRARFTSFLLNTLAGLSALLCTSVVSSASTVATPTFSPGAGTYTSTQTVTISDSTSGATIYYTTNGSTPTTSSTQYTGAIAVSSTETIKAIGTKSGYTQSAVGSATYTITPTVATPTFSPGAGTYTSTQTVTISDSTSGATIYYTTNGSTPTTSSTHYTGVITVSATETVKAIATATGYSQSAVGSAVYTFQASTPIFSPATGTYTSSQTVTISDSSPGAAIYYTTDGTTPTTSSTAYTGAITVSSSETVEAIAVVSGYPQSAVATAVYTLQTPTPTFSPGTGTYANGNGDYPVYVTISDANSTATVYYTLTNGTTGTTPTTSSNVYSGSIGVGGNGTMTVEAIAVVPGYSNSAVATAVYTIQALPPTFSLAAGSYVGNQTLTMSDMTGGNTKIYYTTNGTTPTTGSTRYTAAITVSSTETINAIATSSSYSNSPVTSAAFTITSGPATPTFSPTPGAYSGAQLVMINESSLNATVYYTVTSGTAGTTPTTSSNVYNGAITVGSTETLEAIAAVTGYTSSPAAIATYTLPTIAASTTALTVISGGNPVTTVTAGNLVTLTATVASGGTAVTNGTVNFCDATATYCTDIHLLGTAQLTGMGTAAINFLPSIGNHSYKAVLVGTLNYLTSSSSPAQLAVTGGPTTTTIISNSGGAYPLTATVTGTASGSVVPTGTVSFLDTSNANAVLGTATLSSAGSTSGFTNVSNLSLPNSTSIYNDSNLVAVGDFNRDGKSDLAVTGDSNITILLSNGDGTFTQANGSPFTVSGCYGYYSILVSDFNKDGKLDLAVPCASSGPVTALLGIGDGTFIQREGSQSSSSNGSANAATGDFNGDGIPDLALLNMYGYPGSVTILLGNGDGTFTEALGSPFGAGNEPESLAVGDFNGDGKLDIAVADLYDSYVSILVGNGDGTFAAATASRVNGKGPYSVAVGDFNGDGKLDLVVANDPDVIAQCQPASNCPYAPTVSVLLGRGDGTLGSLNPIGVGIGPQAVVVGDFNGDGTPDAAVALYGDSANDGANPTITTLQTNAVQTATATFTGTSPIGSGTHNVDASYGGDNYFIASTSATTPLKIPWITTISPSYGLIGAFINIGGTNLGPNAGCSSSYVTFNGTVATTTHWTDTGIQALVPIGATSGPVVVNACIPGTNSYFASNAFGFYVPAGPVITGLNPAVGAVGDSVTLSGQNLVAAIQNGPMPSATVTFNGISTRSADVGLDSVTVNVPAGATSGPVVLFSNTGTSNSVNFNVRPAILGFIPAQGSAGTVVSISGTTFGATQGNSELTFGGVPAIPSSWSDTNIVAAVPSGATTGVVEVQVNGMSAVGPVFTLLPSISNLSPASGPVGTQVTILGQNFGVSQGSSSVSFGVVNGSPTLWTPTKIIVSVPSGTVTGAVTVSVNGQTSNAMTFAVGMPTSTGSISGIITQSDGVTPVAGATVLITQASGVISSLVTTTSGGFAASDLNPGTYAVQVSAPGFGVGSQPGVVVSSGQATVVDLSLVGRTMIAYDYDELGRLVGVTDPTQGTATYSYDSVGNILSIQRGTPGQVSIFDFTPKSGPLGTVVTISGNAFSADAQQDTVTFASGNATVSSASAHELTVTVPAGATTGPITVTAPSGTSTSSLPFTVTSGASVVAPSITTFTPITANVGATVTISGTGFDSLQNNRVKFNGTLASVTNAIPTSVSATVPSNATSGHISITTPGGSSTSSADFFAIPSSLTPSQVDFTGRITTGGNSFSGTINNGGDIGVVLFDGTLGQAVSLQITNSTITSAQLVILSPNGSILASNSVGTGSASIPLPAAPATGTYSVIVEPQDPSYTGSITLGLPQTVDTSIQSGVPQLLNFGTPGQIAQFTFTGPAGQLVSIGASGINLSGGSWCGADVNIMLPSGKTLASTTMFDWGMAGYDAFLQPITLPVSGTYTLIVTPENTCIGTATVTLWLFYDQLGTISPGSPQSMNFTIQGQRTLLSFPGSAGQSASWVYTYLNLTGRWCTALTSILKQDGTAIVTNQMFDWGMAGRSLTQDPVVLPTSGTYTLVIAPQSGCTGNGQITLTIQ